MPKTSISLALLLAAGVLCAQAQSFEVVSLKPNNSGSGRATESTGPGRVRLENTTVSGLIQEALGVKAFQISGGPGWLTSDYYDLNATTGTSKDLNDRELRPYFEAMLADRVHLRYRRETRESQIYSLTAAKGGPKLTAHQGEGDSSNRISNGSEKSSLQSTNISMADFARMLGDRVGRVVVDNTGLSGRYDLKLDWAPNPTAESPVPSLFTALQEQLGLKLESAKGPVEFIVIDNVEKPTEN